MTSSYGYNLLIGDATMVPTYFLIAHTCGCDLICQPRNRVKVLLTRDAPIKIQEFCLIGVPISYPGLPLLVLDLSSKPKLPRSRGKTGYMGVDQKFLYIDHSGTHQTIMTFTTCDKLPMVFLRPEVMIDHPQGDAPFHGCWETFFTFCLWWFSG